MIDKLLEVKTVKTRMEASVAAHKVVHPGTELPVATMELVLDEFASKYSTVATVEGAYSLQLMEAFGAQPAAALMGEEQQPHGCSSSRGAGRTSPADSGRLAHAGGRASALGDMMASQHQQMHHHHPTQQM